MTTFLTLLLAHLLADFPLQTDRIFRWKIAGNSGLILHVIIHLVMTALLLAQPEHHLDLLFILGIAHFITDWVKVRFPGEPQWPGFLLDQLAHLVVLFVLSVWRPGLTAVLPAWLILPLTLFVVIPAGLTLFWVWANDMQQQARFTHSRVVPWASSRLLVISQRAGWIAVFLVLACRFFFVQ